MSQYFALLDPLAISDLQLYLTRVGRVEDGSVRLIGGSGVLAAYTAVLYPHGLLDRTPTVLALRTFAIAADAAFDVVVPTRSLLDRLARAAEQSASGDPAVVGERAEPVGIRLPLEVSTVTWAGISPPRGGWRRIGETASAALRSAARAGIDEVAGAIPEGTGEQLVWRVRGEVWGAPMPGLEYLPAGAAFAAETLGFLGGDDEPDEAMAVFETGPWLRVTARRGHVLVKTANWSLHG